MAVQSRAALYCLKRREVDASRLCRKTTFGVLIYGLSMSRLHKSFRESFEKNLQQISCLQSPNEFTEDWAEKKNQQAFEKSQATTLCKRSSP